MASFLPRTKMSPDDGLSTHSSREQSKVEDMVARIFRSKMFAKEVTLDKANHIKYLSTGLRSLPSGFSQLDAQKPWLVYWIVHSLELLDALPDKDTLTRVVSTIKACKGVDGGYGGGPLQLGHLAPSYAAISTLAIVGTKEAYDSIDRDAMLAWLKKLRVPGGGFCMHVDGEADVRATYCAMVIASYLNGLTPEITEGVPEYIASCQSWDGGIGGAPFNEAHGGYTFCGIAALAILGKTDVLDLDRLAYWAVSRQMRLEGGFQGRTNKLVDGCYSFWQGATHPILYDALNQANKGTNEFKSGLGQYIFDQIGLQQYILFCCQDPRGGLRDKPDVRRDFYHTCYCLSGLSIAQSNANKEMQTIFGNEKNIVVRTNALYNVGDGKEKKMMEYFKQVSE